MLPVGAGILAPAILFWGVRYEPCTVRAVRCAWGGIASGTNCRGMGWVMSIVQKGLSSLYFCPVVSCASAIE